MPATNYFGDVNVTSALLGGAVLALATSLNLFLKGRITGCSGTVSYFVSPDMRSTLYRPTFICGLILGAYLYMQRLPDAKLEQNAKQYFEGLSQTGFLVSGFLVGFGTNFGNGCTSGHGLCGIPRLSLRSIVATLVFMGAGVATATYRHLNPFYSESVSPDIWAPRTSLTTFAALAACTLVAIIVLHITKQAKGQSEERPRIQAGLFEGLTDIIVSTVVGGIFAVGLILAGMDQRHKVLGFLNFAGPQWDPSMLIVFFTGVFINLFTFQFFFRFDVKPLLSKASQYRFINDINWRLLTGAAIFGIGWGICGICPGPSLINAITYCPFVLVNFTSMMLVGMFMSIKLTDILREMEHAQYANKMKAY